MKKLGLLTLAGLALTLGTVSNGVLNVIPSEVHDAEIIVQLKADSEGKTREQVLQSQNLIFDEIRETITPSFEVKTRYVNVLNGFTLRVNQSHVDDIRHLSGVKLVNYNKAHAVKTTDEKLVLTKEAAVETDNASADTMEKPAGTKEGEGTFVAVLDSSFLLTHEAFTELDADVKTKVSQESLRPIITADSFHGKPGADENQSTYWNNKVPFYYDYGGELHSIEDEGAPGDPDWDVSSPISEHGNHVASIVGANGPYKGIAPKTQLALMKVFTEVFPTKEEKEDGYADRIGAYDSVILMALEDATAMGVDVINMSLGTNLNDFEEDGSNIVVNQLRLMKEKGIFASIAAGNAGKDTFNKTGAYANWTTDMQETGIFSTYGNDDSTMSVAAGQPDRQYYDTALLINGRNVAYEDQCVDYNSADGEVKFEPNRHLEDITKGGTRTDFDWVKIPNFGKITDYEGLDVKGKIVIVDRGENTFTQKVQNAEDKEAIAIAVINNDPSENDFKFRMDFAGYSPKIPVITILFRDRDIFLGSNANPLQIIIKQVAVNPSARTMADFSTDGATYNLGLKPDITTPGLNIKGAVISGNDAYDYLSGTSMAAPNYAGSLALILSEHLNDEAYRESIYARTMSTAQIMMDVNNVNYASVRQQGSGMLDIKATLDSKVWIEGVDGEGNGTDKAKVELRNNDLIKNGTIKLSFLVHNELDHPVTYTAVTSVFRPDTVELEAERYPEFAGNHFQTTYNKLITKDITQDFTVEPGTHLVTLNEYNLTDEVKTEIKNLFEYGCHIEGFVELTSKDAQANSMNFPYMGYYGDYTAQAPVEPFKHERDNTKTWPSDLVNSLGRGGLALDNCDFASGMVQGYYPSFDDIDLTPMVLNTSNIWQMKDYSLKQLINVGTNPYTNKVESSKDIYVGNNGISNTVLIQQFVTRSVYDNRIHLINKASGEEVLLSAVFDTLLFDENAKTYPLYKSHVDSDFIGNNILSHRGYSVIPTYNPETMEIFPDGEYELQFEYVLAIGTTYTMSYNMHIDNTSPAMESLENITVSGKEMIRVRYEDQGLSYVAINGRKYPIQKDEKGYYIDIEKSKYESRNKVTVKAVDKAFGDNTMMFHINDVNGVIIENKDIVPSLDFVTNITDVENNPKDKIVEFVFNKKGVVQELSGSSFVTFKLFDGFDFAKTKIYSIGKDGKTRSIPFNYIDDKVSFRTPSLKIRVMETEGEVIEPRSQAMFFAQNFLDMTAENCKNLVVQDKATWDALAAQWSKLDNEAKEIFKNNKEIEVIQKARERYNFIVNKYAELTPFIDGMEKAKVTKVDNKGELIGLVLITSSVFVAAGLALVVVLSKKSKKKITK